MHLHPLKSVVDQVEVVHHQEVVVVVVAAAVVVVEHHGLEAKRVVAHLQEAVLVENHGLEERAKVLRVLGALVTNQPKRDLKSLSQMERNGKKH